MKIAVSATGRDLNSDLDPRFGRAAYFVLFDTDASEAKAVANTQNLNLPQGAGIQAAKTIIDQGAAVLITGHCGPKAFKVLQAAGVRIMTGAGGTVADALQEYNQGKLTQAEGADVEGHWV
jgi:predicted Fe-Mo cluster-binding NifX family protein